MKEVKIYLVHGSCRKSRSSIKSKRLMGLLGGHASIEVDGQVYEFTFENYSFRILPKSSDPIGILKRTGALEWRSATQWEKLTAYTIMTNPASYQKLKNLLERLVGKTSMDYALVGARCCSVHYEVLRRADIVKSGFITRFLAFFPTTYILLFRHLLYAENYTVNKQNGDPTRLWI